MQWDVEIEAPPAVTDLAGGARGDKSSALAELATALQPLSVKSSLADGQLRLAGQQSLDQLRTTLFDEESGQINFLGGPVALTLTLPANNQPITLELEARVTTGYRWEVLASEQGRYRQQEADHVEMRYAGPGAPAIQKIELQPQGRGDNVVQLVYRRPFEPEAPIRLRMNLRATTPLAGGVIELTDPTPIDSGASSQPGAGVMAQPDLALPALALPTAYDARTQGLIPPVRNQGSCGSCWAFGTVGVMETAIKQGGGPLTDLSEQFLVSCNKEGWDCDGGWFASKYHYTTLGYNQTTAGATLEAAKPYTATNGTCTTNLSHPYQASQWQFVGYQSSIPANDLIKTAIMTYGAVAAAVCADSGWSRYTGGVYSPASNGCGNSVNHAILLVGWNDADQSWILRNSWGTNWGETAGGTERGYMRIKYDPTGANSKVGYGANWIQFVAGGTIPAIPATPNASDGTYSDRVGITWTAVSGATKYEVYRATSASGTKTLLGSPTAASYDDRGAVAGTIYYYWLKACNSAGCSGFSSYNTGYRASSARPDLIVTTVTGPTTGTRGKTITVKWQVKNQGTAKAGAHYSRLYFSTDTAISTTDIASATCYHSAGIPVGTTQTCSVSVTIPTSLTPRAYYLGVIADYTGLITEANETNNARAAATSIMIK
ncbi:MAG: protease inhibitor I42 family protein [Chromatiaceae bacterium]|nr:protease inhibitor I42 family protein [Chromatiaceae bacterium]